MLSFLPKFSITTWLIGAIIVTISSLIAYLKIQNANLQTTIQAQKNASILLKEEKSKLAKDIADLSKTLAHANSSIESLQEQLIMDRKIAEEHTKALINSKKQLSDKILALELESAKNDSDFSKCLNVVVPDEFSSVLKPSKN